MRRLFIDNIQAVQKRHSLLLDITAGLFVGIRAIFYMRNLNLREKYDTWGVFLRDPSPYLGEFRRNPRITPNG